MCAVLIGYVLLSAQFLYCEEENRAGVFIGRCLQHLGLEVFIMQADRLSLSTTSWRSAMKE